MAGLKPQLNGSILRRTALCRLCGDFLYLYFGNFCNICNLRILYIISNFDNFWNIGNICNMCNIPSFVWTDRVTEMKYPCDAYASESKRNL